jgi:hypothetical protein
MWTLAQLLSTRCLLSWLPPLPSPWHTPVLLPWLPQRQGIQWAMSPGTSQQTSGPVPSWVLGLDPSRRERRTQTSGEGCSAETIQPCSDSYGSHLLQTHTEARAESATITICCRGGGCGSQGAREAHTSQLHARHSSA